MKIMNILSKSAFTVLKPTQILHHIPVWHQQRNLMSRQLVYNEFGDPLHVVKYRECEVPPLGKQDVLVRMLAAPVNPADINTIQGNFNNKAYYLSIYYRFSDLLNKENGACFDLLLVII